MTPIQMTIFQAFAALYVILQVLGNFASWGKKQEFHLTSAIIVMMGSYISLPRPFCGAYLAYLIGLTVLAVVHVIWFARIRMDSAPNRFRSIHGRIVY